jgi:hypothetical protein
MFKVARSQSKVHCVSTASAISALFSKNRSGDMFQSRSSAKSTTKMDVIRWMEEILHQLIGGLYPIRFQPSKVMQDFFHPQYDAISGNKIYRIANLVPP